MTTDERWEIIGLDFGLSSTATTTVVSVWTVSPEAAGNLLVYQAFFDQIEQHATTINWGNVLPDGEEAGVGRRCYLRKTFRFMYKANMNFLQL